MIFQNFIKGGTERVNYGYFEYVSGADIIFDFGNPTCTVDWNTNKLYNVGNTNVTASRINGAVLENRAGGVMTTDYNGSPLNATYVEWSGSVTKEITEVVFFATASFQYTPASSNWPYVLPNANTVRMNGSTEANVDIYDNAGNRNEVFAQPLNQSSTNSRGGFNMVLVTSNGNDLHQYYENDDSPIISTLTIVRDTATNKNFYLGLNSNLSFISYLQYPFVLTPKQIRQTYKVFSQRFFL